MGYSAEIVRLMNKGSWTPVIHREFTKYKETADGDNARSQERYSLLVFQKE